MGVFHLSRYYAGPVTTDYRKIRSTAPGIPGAAAEIQSNGIEGKGTCPEDVRVRKKQGFFPAGLIH
jgi:hypothetical protein